MRISRRGHATGTEVGEREIREGNPMLIMVRYMGAGEHYEALHLTPDSRERFETDWRSFLSTGKPLGGFYSCNEAGNEAAQRFPGTQEAAPVRLETLSGIGREMQRFIVLSRPHISNHDQHRISLPDFSLADLCAGCVSSPRNAPSG